MMPAMEVEADIRSMRRDPMAATVVAIPPIMSSPPLPAASCNGDHRRDHLQPRLAAAIRSPPTSCRHPTAPSRTPPQPSTAIKSWSTHCYVVESPHVLRHEASPPQTDLAAGWRNRRRAETGPTARRSLFNITARRDISATIAGVRIGYMQLSLS
jgi:hypothetical protein